MASCSGNTRFEYDPSIEALADVFKCFICMEQLVNARMCPYCSKLCCFECICKWITENKAQCPHCRRTLHTPSLVNCRWADEVIQQLERLKTLDIYQSVRTPEFNSDMCMNHNERLTVYCSTCDRVLCHRCALFDSHHSQHTFRPLDEVHGEHVVVIRNEMEKLKGRRADVQKLINDVRDNILLLNARKDSRVEEIKRVADSIILRLESLYISKLSTLTSQRNHLTQETELIDSLLHEVEVQLNSTSPANLIFSSPTLSAMFAEVQKTPMPFITCDHNPYDFASELVPSYATSEFVIHNFSLVQRQAEPIYSPLLECGALKWRLKVYPSGNGVVRGQYLSVFLEMTFGRGEPSRYEYYIQLMHQGPPQDDTKCIAREFASDFAVGECWGYNRFVRLDLLNTEGYVSSIEDCLCFNYMVRPQTYQQQCRDYLWYITQIEDQNEELQKEVRRLDTQLRMQKCYSALNCASHEQSPNGNEVPSGDSQFSNVIDEGDCDDALRLSVSLDRCLVSTPATTTATQATPSGSSDEGSGENVRSISAPLSADEDETHEVESEVSDFNSDTDIDSGDCAGDASALQLNLPTEVQFQEEDRVEDIISIDEEGEQVGSLSSDFLGRQHRSAEENFNGSGSTEHSLPPWLPTLVDDDLITVHQGNTSNTLSDVVSNHSSMSCDMRQLVYYLTFAPHWISREGISASPMPYSEHIDQLLQHLLARLPGTEQSEVGEGGEGNVESTRRNIVNGEDKNQSDVLYGLLRGLREFKSLRSHGDLFSINDAVLPAQRNTNGGTRPLDTNELRPASASSLCLSQVTSRLAQGYIQNRYEFRRPLPSNDDLLTSRSSPLDFSVTSPPNPYTISTRVNLNIIRERIREIQDGATACASILAASISSDSDQECQRQSTSFSGAMQADADINSL